MIYLKTQDKVSSSNDSDRGVITSYSPSNPTDQEGHGTSISVSLMPDLTSQSPETIRQSRKDAKAPRSRIKKFI